jgi:hypothetical protein
VKNKVRTVEELEAFIGIQRTEPPRPTQKDALNLRRKRLARSPFWKTKTR